MPKFFIKSADYVCKCKTTHYALLPEWEKRHVCRICCNCIIGEISGYSKREVSKETFLDELATQRCYQQEYLCSCDCDCEDDDIIRHYEDLEEEILSNQFPDKEYNLEI